MPAMVLAALLILLLVLVNGFYVAAEFAVVSARRSRIHQLAEQGVPAARVLEPILEDGRQMDRFIAATQVGITLAGLVLGALGQATLSAPLAGLLAAMTPLSPPAAGSVATVGVLVILTVLQVIVGELVPKSLALQFTTRTALLTIRPLLVTQRLFYWFTILINHSGLLVLRALGLPQGSHRHIHSPDEIDLLIVDSADGGLLEPDELQRLHQALQLSLHTAAQLMVPRTRIQALNLDLPVDQLIRQAVDSPYTRLPAYRGTSDNIAGILHTKDLALRHLSGQAVESLEPLLRPVAFVPETMTGDILLATLRERHAQMAMVVDEFGGVAGLITLEDVVEELIGQVSEQSHFGQPPAERLPDGRVRLPGLMRLDEAEPWIGQRWESEANTVSGHITSVLGRIPEPGEHLIIAGNVVEVEDVANHAIVSLLVSPVGERRRHTYG